jgi:C4-dicarboxylate-specific signal transduction histidine kinase
MVRSAIAKNRVAVSTHPMDGLVPIRGDCVQLQQVVVNLILNAVEAMSSVEDGVRELSIRTEQSQAGGILVAVLDSGPGIDPGISSEFSNRFTPQRPAESEWVCRSADPSPTAMEAGCG